MAELGAPEVPEGPFHIPPLRRIPLFIPLPGMQGNLLSPQVLAASVGPARPVFRLLYLSRYGSRVLVLDVRWMRQLLGLD